MPHFQEYEKTAGVPNDHITIFKQIAIEERLVISSRELNPCCTDLLLEGYAAKGFHIKAKTCDWGPMAGFVPADHRFTKKSADPENQRTCIADAFQEGAMAMPLHISSARYRALKTHKVLWERQRCENQLDVTAISTKSHRSYQFILVRNPRAQDVGADMWCVCYHPDEGPPPDIHCRARAQAKIEEFTPVMAMVNPQDAKRGMRNVKSIVTGDYDLWCVFAHDDDKDYCINDRQMFLRSTLPKDVVKKNGCVLELAVRAKLVYRDESAKPPAQRAKNRAASELEDKDLGNVSQGILKVRRLLNEKFGRNLVQHSDFGGNPFGEIDFPLIFFIPIAGAADAEVKVVDSTGELRDVLNQIKRAGFAVKLPAHWTLRNFRLPTDS